MPQQSEGFVLGFFFFCPTGGKCSPVRSAFSDGAPPALSTSAGGNELRQWIPQ